MDNDSLKEKAAASHAIKNLDFFKGSLFHGEGSEAAERFFICLLHCTHELPRCGCGPVSYDSDIFTHGPILATVNVPLCLIPLISVGVANATDHRIVI